MDQADLRGRLGGRDVSRRQSRDARPGLLREQALRGRRPVDAGSQPVDARPRRRRSPPDRTHPVLRRGDPSGPRLLRVALLRLAPRPSPPPPPPPPPYPEE